jgi:two-component system, NarL family, sensor kinase
VVNQPLPLLPGDVETVAELRALYRAAEARAARMRLLSTSGRELAAAGQAGIEAVLQSCAERLAWFTGRSAAAVHRGPGGAGLTIPAPGEAGGTLGCVAIAGLDRIDDLPDPEDRETVRLHLELMGAAMDRIAREEERGRLLAALQEREQRLEFLVGRLFSAQEEERRRVAHDLHDGVAQTVTAMVRMIEGAGAADQLDAAQRARLAAIARECLAELRGVIGGLRPTILDDLGLEAGLRWLAEGLEADGFVVDLRVAGDIARWPPHVETALFRVAQEAVSNIRKHAGGPCRVALELRGARPGGRPSLRIADSGRGASAGEGREPAPGSGLGIDIMRERMTAIGARLEWQSGRNGVTVTAFLPEPA